MPATREDLMRLLIEIDEQWAGLRDLVEGPEAETESDARSEVFYRMVTLGAAQRMVEEKLNEGEKPGQLYWEDILAFVRLSKTWPDS